MDVIQELQNLPGKPLAEAMQFQLTGQNTEWYVQLYQPTEKTEMLLSME